ncbi:hypothetical protein DPMN_076012 [Dreissena polymorpha]|uniref:Uncharacterized protein n=1 Tax=Dreissena polymorpha TaxID=45954 RepID=A0A9D4BM10_DREPO|nr:hypothetical protein DPMN_076012 [Dreissena polymorpha]
MSNYPGYPPSFSSWNSFTPSNQNSFPAGNLYLPGSYLPAVVRSSLLDPLSAIPLGFHSHPTSRYLPQNSDIPALGLEPLYGFGPYEPRNLLHSPNFHLSQNPSPLTFDQIYRSGASSVSPVSNHRSQLDERSFATRLNIPGHISEPLRPEFPWHKKSNFDDGKHCRTDIGKQDFRIWKPFERSVSEVNEEYKELSRPKAKGSFTIDSLTEKNITFESSEQTATKVDANGNFEKHSVETSKSVSEKPAYPIRPIPVISSGCSFTGKEIKHSLPKNYLFSKENSFLVQDQSLKSSTILTNVLRADTVYPQINEVNKPSAKAYLKIEQENPVVTNTFCDNPTTNNDCAVNADDEAHSIAVAKSDVENINNQSNTVSEAVKNCLPSLKIEIPSSGKKVLKTPELISPTNSFSPTKGKHNKKDELQLLSNQVNEVRSRRLSKEFKEVLSPTLLSPKVKESGTVAQSNVSEQQSEQTVSEDARVQYSSENKKGQNSQCSKVKERRLSAPLLRRCRPAFPSRPRMSSTDGSISVLKNMEDSLGASVSSSHLSESDSDTQMSNADSASKMFPESHQSHNTQAGFSHEHNMTGNHGYMSQYGMNHDNHFYKDSASQLCQSQTDNQKQYQCVPGPPFSEKHEPLPPYHCYGANQSPSILPREPSYHTQEENSNFPPTTVDPLINYDENSVMSDSSQLPSVARCDSEPNLLASLGTSMVTCKNGAMQPMASMPHQDQCGIADEGQWDFLHSKQYIENIYGSQISCASVKSESDEIRESDSPKTFIDLDKTTKEKKAQEHCKDNMRDGSKPYGKGIMRQGSPLVHRSSNQGNSYGNQMFDNYNHMAGNRWGNFNRASDGNMGGQPMRPGDPNYQNQSYDQYRGNFPPNYPNMGPNQNGNEKSFNQSSYHGNEYNQSDYYNPSHSKNLPGNHGSYGNQRFENGFYPNRGGSEFNTQGNMFPPSPVEQQGSRYPSQGYNGGQGNYSQHYSQQSGHCPPDSLNQYGEMPNYIPRNASPASTGSDFGSMDAPGVVPKKKRGRKRKVDKEPPDENKPRPNTVVMASTKLGPLIDIDNPEATIDTYDFDNQIETIFNFTIEDDLSPIGAQFLQIEQRLVQKMLPIKYGYPVTVIYSPLTYAFQTHRDFVSKYCTTERTLLFLGMNPGPYGASQNGVKYSL